MLEDIASLMNRAERLAELVADLCQRGEPVDNEVAGLTAALSGVVSHLPNGVPPELHPRWQLLAERVADATTAAEARASTLATELEQQARHGRIRRAYIRPPT